MRVTSLVLGSMMFLAIAGAVRWGSAQEPAAPKSAGDAAKPFLPLTIIEQSTIVPRETLTKDDLSHVPPPPVDRLSESVRATVVVGSPQCLPGEDLLLGPGELPRAPRRPRPR